MNTSAPGIRALMEESQRKVNAIINNPIFSKPDQLSLYGMKVIVSNMLPYTVKHDNRPLKAKQWHGNRGTGRYALRVAKKWRKRFGQHEEIIDCMIIPDIHCSFYGGRGKLEPASKIVMLSRVRFNQLKEATRG